MVRNEAAAGDRWPRSRGLQQYAVFLLDTRSRHRMLPTSRSQWTSFSLPLRASAARLKDELSSLPSLETPPNASSPPPASTRVSKHRLSPSPPKLTRDLSHPIKYAPLSGGTTGNLHVRLLEEPHVEREGSAATAEASRGNWLGYQAEKPQATGLKILALDSTTSS